MAGFIAAPKSGTLSESAVIKWAEAPEKQRCRASAGRLVLEMKMDLQKSVLQLKKEIKKRLSIDCYEGPVDPVSISQQISPEYGGLSESIPFMPVAISHTADKHERYIEISSEIVSFLKVWQRDLEQCGLWHRMSCLPLSILLNWSAKWDPNALSQSTPESNSWLRTVSSVAVDIDFLLNSVLESQITVDRDLLFKNMFEGWYQAATNEVHCTNLSLFVYRVKSAPSSLPVYRSEIVLAKAFDPRICKSLWENAHNFLNKVLPPPKLERVRSTVLSN